MTAAADDDDEERTRTVHRTTRETDALIKRRVNAARRVLGRRPRVNDVLAAGMELAERHADEFVSLLARRGSM